MHHFVFLFLALYSFSTASSRDANQGLRGFSIDLIHHDSPLSPFYNPSLTPSERIENAALRSISRLNKASYSFDENKSPKSILIPDHGEYLMRFYIGTPPVERLAIADTASDLIWVQCSSCVDCFPQDTPLFDPTKSSTYTRVECGSQVCTLVPQPSYCAVLCMYLYSYGDTSYTTGALSTETISLGSTDGSQTITFQNSIFGCGMSNRFTYRSSDKVTGLVGLGAGPLSLVSQIGDQIGHKFSYCLLPLGSNSTSKLKFGSEAIIKGNGVVSTPLIIDPSFPSYYLLRLEGVTVGKKTVQTDQTGGNIIIDSGTLLTYLEYNFYNEFVASLQELLGVEAILEDLPKPFDFCFPYKDMVFPDIVFQFTGAKVSLGPKNTLFRFHDKNMLCLAVVPNDLYSSSAFSIFGNVAQIDFQVEYDLEEKKVSFAPTDCSKN